MLQLMQINISLSCTEPLPKDGNRILSVTISFTEGANLADKQQLVLDKEAIEEIHKADGLSQVYPALRALTLYQ